MFDYTITVHAEVPAARAGLDLQLPPGVGLLEGPPSWSGPVRTSEQLAYRFSVPDEGRHTLVFIAWREDAAGRRGDFAFQLDLDLGAPDPRPIGGVLRDDGTGRRVRDYRVE